MDLLSKGPENQLAALALRLEEKYGVRLRAESVVGGLKLVVLCACVLRHHTRHVLQEVTIQFCLTAGAQPKEKKEAPYI